MGNMSRNAEILGYEPLTLTVSLRFEFARTDCRSVS